MLSSYVKSSVGDPTGSGNGRRRRREGARTGAHVPAHRRRRLVARPRPCLSLRRNPRVLSKEDNEILCRVGAGTPMGEFFRRFWTPVALGSGAQVDSDDSTSWQFCSRSPTMSGHWPRSRSVCEDRSPPGTQPVGLGSHTGYCKHRANAGSRPDHRIRAYFATGSPDDPPRW